MISTKFLRALAAKRQSLDCCASREQFVYDRLELTENLPVQPNRAHLGPVSGLPQVLLRSKPSTQNEKMSMVYVSTVHRRFMLPH